MASCYIDDGFTLEDTFQKVGWQAEVKFRYRPALAQDVHAYWAERADDKKSMRIQDINVAFIKKHLCSWDAKDNKGNVLDFTQDKVWARVTIQLQQYIVMCVLGEGGNPVNVEGTAKN